MFCGSHLLRADVRRLVPGGAELRARPIPLQTPPHIAPVWYFTPFYAMLRAVPSFAGTQVWGVLVMGAAVVVLFFLPWLDRAPVKSIRYRGPIYKFMLAIFVISFSRSASAALKPPSGIYPHAGQGLHGPVFRVLRADAVVLRESTA